MNRATAVQERGLAFLTALCLGVLVLPGCSSVRREHGSQAILRGMIYDYENRPVSGYAIGIHGGRKTATDISGRFSFPSVSFGKLEINGGGPSHLTESLVWNFDDRMQILYLRIPSVQWAWKEADELLGRGKPAEAKHYLDRFPPDVREGAVWKLYEAIARYRLATAEMRPSILEEIDRYNLEVLGDTKK